MKPGYNARIRSRLLSGLTTGQATDFRAVFFFGDTQFVLLLQIEPEFRAHPEPMAEAQSCIGSDRAPAIENGGNSVCRNLQITREFGGRHTNFMKFVVQDSAGMDGSS